MRRFQDFTTVESCLDGDIILIGEKHGNERSGGLARDVLGEVEPGVIAVEEPPNKAVIPRGAMGAAVQYSRDNQLDFAKIDIESRRREFASRVDDMARFHAVANSFSSPIQPSGDLQEQAIWDARNGVKDRFGEAAWRIMYPIREQEMARRLLTLRENYDGPVVAAIGAFHVPAVSQFLAHEEPLEKIDDNRVRA